MTFGPLLRQWRIIRRRSQFDLALDAGVSARHISFMETGRSQPSRQMVLALGEALDVPLRERNSLLQAAGFAAVYRQTPIEAPEMEQVRAAIRCILAGHGTNPAMVVNRRYELLDANPAARALTAWILGCEPQLGATPPNMLRMTVRLLRPYIENWDEVGGALLKRARREAEGSTDPGTVEALTELGASLEPIPSDPQPPPLMIPIRFARDGIRLSFFSTITTLGTPIDITLEELRIESLFPADAETVGRMEGVLRWVEGREIGAPLGGEPQ